MERMCRRMKSERVNTDILLSDRKLFRNPYKCLTPRYTDANVMYIAHTVLFLQTPYKAIIDVPVPLRWFASVAVH